MSLLKKQQKNLQRHSTHDQNISQVLKEKFIVQCFPTGHPPQAPANAS